MLVNKVSNKLKMSLMGMLYWSILIFQVHLICMYLLIKSRKCLTATWLHVILGEMNN